MTQPRPGEYSFGRDRLSRADEQPQDSPAPQPSELSRAELRRQRETRGPIPGHSSLTVAIPLGVATVFMLIWTGASLAVTFDEINSEHGDDAVIGMFMTAISVVITIGLSAWLFGILRRRRAYRRLADDEYIKAFGHDPDDGYPQWDVQTDSAQRLASAPVLGSVTAADSAPEASSQSEAAWQESIRHDAALRSTLAGGVLDTAAQSTIHGVPPPPPGFRGTAALSLIYGLLSVSLLFTLAIFGVTTDEYTAGSSGDAVGMLFFLVPSMLINMGLLAWIITIHRRRAAYRRILDLKYQELFGFSPGSPDDGVGS